MISPSPRKKSEKKFQFFLEPRTRQTERKYAAGEEEANEQRYIDSARTLHRDRRSRRPSAPVALDEPYNFEPVDRTYDYGKVKLRQRTPALELFQQCEEMLRAIKVLPSVYRNLDEYKRNCETYEH